MLDAIIGALIICSISSIFMWGLIDIVDKLVRTIYRCAKRNITER